MKCSKPRNHSCHLWMVVGLGNSPGYIINLLVKSSGLDWFMILFEKVGQKVHQNHATSLECNHDGIVIPVPEFVPFACSVSSGLSSATFFVQSGLNCCAMQQMDEPNCFAMQQSGLSFSNVSETLTFQTFQTTASQLRKGCICCASAVLLYFDIRTQSYCAHLHFQTPFHLKVFQATQRLRSTFIID